MGVITRTLDQPSFCPQWAQNSRHVYYTKPGENCGESYCEHDIWVIDTHTGEKRNLTNTPDRDEDCVIYWPARPDTLLFFFTPVEMLDNIGTGWLGYLGSVEADGARYSIISENILSPPSLSSDGVSIAYTGSHANLGYQLHLYYPESGSQLVDWGMYGLEGWKVFIDSVSWSPEGNRLACWAHGKSQHSRFDGILVLDLETRTTRILQPITHPVYFDGVPPAPVWSPDGQWLVFQGTDKNSTQGIWIVRVDGQEVYVISGTLDKYEYWNPGIIWSPDGEWMAFVYDDLNPKKGVWLAKVGTWELFPTTLPSDSSVITWLRDLP